MMTKIIDAIKSCETLNCIYILGIDGQVYQGHKIQGGNSISGYHPIFSGICEKEFDRLMTILKAR